MNNYKPVALMLGIAVLVLTGCSSDRISSPSGPQGLALSEGSAAAWVGPDGGRLSATGSELRIPSGALTALTYITMSRLPDGSVELGPHGQQFKVAVFLSFQIPAGVDTALTNVQWFDPSSDRWVVIPSIASSGKRVAALAHFSKYQMGCTVSDND